MCKLSETSEWWTSLGASHDERIITAIARSKARARARCNAMARCSAEFCTLTDAELGENFWSPRMPDDDCWREQIPAVSGPACVCVRTELFRQESVGRRVFFDFCGSFRDLARDSCIKACNLRERRSVKIHTCFRQWHDSARCTYEHTRFQSISPDQVWYLFLPSLMRTLRLHGSRKRFTAYDTESYHFITKPNKTSFQFGRRGEVTTPSKPKLPPLSSPSSSLNRCRRQHAVSWVVSSLIWAASHPRSLSLVCCISSRA